MKMSENKIIRILNTVATIALIFYGVFILTNLIDSNVPKAGKGVKGYQIFNVRIIESDVNKQKVDRMKIWFNNNLVIQEMNKSIIFLRFQNSKDLFSKSAIVFQLVQFCYWFSIGVLLWFIKKFFQSLCKDEMFTQKNASRIMVGSLLLIWLPIVRWLTQEMFLTCVEQLHLNDSRYSLANGESLFGSETFIGLVLFAFGLAFKIGVDMKKENEEFI